MISADDFLIALRKTLRISFMSEILNFFCLFIMFRMSFLIICENDFTACSYSKFFMLLKFVCNFFRKKLYCSMFTFFCVVRAACHLKQLLSNIIVLEQQCNSSNVSFVVVLKQHYQDASHASFNVVLKQQHCSTLFICSYKNKIMSNSDSK